MKTEELAKEIKWGSFIVTFKVADGKIISKIIYPQEIIQNHKVEGYQGTGRIYKEIELED